MLNQETPAGKSDIVVGLEDLHKGFPQQEEQEAEAGTKVPSGLICY